MNEQDRKTADDLVERGIESDYIQRVNTKWLVDSIAAALTTVREEQWERDAQIAETYYSSGGEYIASRIREGKQ